MFTRRVFGGTPDTFRLSLDYGAGTTDVPGPAHGYGGPAGVQGEGQYHRRRSSSGTAAHVTAAGAPVRLTRSLATLEFDFNTDETEASVIERFTQRTSTIMLERIEQHVVLELLVIEADGGWRGNTLGHVFDLCRLFRHTCAPGGPGTRASVSACRHTLCPHVLQGSRQGRAAPQVQQRMRI